MSRNPLTQPIISGEIAAEGIDWTVTAAHPSEMFWRQLKFAEFDISEMSLASLCIAASHGVRDWIAIPVFTTRRFFHTGIIVRDGAGIGTASDLAGKRVGVPEYQQTAAVWTRGALAHEFDVAPSEMRWFMERPPERSHGGSTGFTPPPGVDLSYIPTGTNLGEMLGSGALDAAIVYLADRNLVDRTRGGSQDIVGLSPLFTDPIAEGVRYYQKTGLLPVNHTVVIRRSVLETSPWVALNVYSAFVDAKQSAYRPFASRGGPELRTDSSVLEPWVQVGAIPSSTLEQTRTTDPLPYGLAGQTVVLDTLGTYLMEQGLITTQVDMSRLFALSTQDL